MMTMEFVDVNQGIRASDARPQDVLTTAATSSGVAIVTRKGLGNESRSTESMNMLYIYEYTDNHIFSIHF